MATSTDLQPYREWNPPAKVEDTSKFGDRAKNFARARRHTVVVRLLRWVLPVSAVVILVVYIGTVLQTIGWVDELPQVSIPSLIPDQLAMDNPRYEGFTSDGGSYVVTAKTAIPNLSDMTLIKLNGIEGDLTDAKKVKTNLKAVRGSYNTKTSKLELYDGIDVVSDNGMRARLSTATVLPKESVVVTKEPVVVELPAGTIRSNEMTMHNKTREVTFLDQVKAHLVPEKSNDAGKPAAKPSASNDAVPIISAGNGPLDITANRLDVDDQKKTAVFSGGVNAVQGGAALQTSTLEVVYDSKDDAAGAAPGAGANISRISSPSPVVLTRAPQDRVTSNRLDFDAKTEVAVLAGDVVMTSGADRRISGEVATINQRDNTILMTGSVLATQGRNRFKAERLFVDRATGRTQLSSPVPDGRIETRFYRDETGKTKQAAKQVVQAATAAGVFKTDPNAPIDVDADRLDVDDRVKTAVYKGDVLAKQGDFTVRTAKLTAYYSGQAGLSQQIDGADGAKKQDAQITRIEARGKVIVTSKDGQSATGDWANFDMKGNKVVVGGDVVLTQEKNVVRGTKLVIDMLTGESIIQNDPGAAWSAKAEPSGEKKGEGVVVQGPLSGGRPSAIFYPRMKDSASKKGTGTANTPDAAGGWQARGDGN